jgi:hypothetical protein
MLTTPMTSFWSPCKGACGRRTVGMHRGLVLMTFRSRLGPARTRESPVGALRVTSRELQPTSGLQAAVSRLQSVLTFACS